PRARPGPGGVVLARTHACGWLAGASARAHDARCESTHRLFAARRAAARSRRARAFALCGDHASTRTLASRGATGKRPGSAGERHVARIVVATNRARVSPRHPRAGSVRDARGHGIAVGAVRKRL